MPGRYARYSIRTPGSIDNGDVRGKQVVSGQYGRTMDVIVAPGIVFPDTGDGHRWVAGAVVVDGAGRAFAQRRAPDRKVFPHCWDVVGGHVEDGETMLGALAREIAEETGWRLAAVDAEIHRLRWTPGDGVERHEADYLVRVEGDLSAPRLEAGKHTESMWVGADGLHLLHDHRDPGDDFIAGIVRTALEADAELRGR